MKLKRVIRLDSMPLGRASFTEEGYLVDTPIVTSTGIFEYTNRDGSIRRELRLPEEVFAKASLDSYEGKPVIITHDAGLVTKDNVSDNEIGTILTKGFQDGDNVRAKIVIHDTDGMKQSGLKELSLGYNLDLDETPGEWNGQPYDAVQRNIRINHLALVREARAGEKARLNIDGRGEEVKGVKLMSNKTISNVLRSDGILSPDELKEAIKEYRARHPEAGNQGATPAVEKDADDPMKKPVPAAEPAAPSVAPAPAPAPEKKAEPAVAPAPAKSAEPAVPVMPEKKDAEENSLAAARDTITRQDEDIQTLLDIIDTLLAERDFKESESNTDADDTKEEDMPVDMPEEEPDNEDDADADIPFTDKAENERAENEDDADADIPFTDKKEVSHQEVMNSDSIDAIVRTRVKLGIVAEKLNLDGIEEMPLTEAKKAVIGAVRPAINLDGKAPAYINALFDMACADVKTNTRKDTSYQRKQMFNGDSITTASEESGPSAEEARARMIERRQNARTKEVK